MQARVGLAKKEIKAGAWAHWGTEETAALVGGETRFTSVAVGLDVSVSLTDKLAIEGECWTGSNLTDIRGGIGQGINRETGEETASTGGWAQVAIKPADRWKLYAGATIDAPDEEAVPRGGRIRNQAFYVVSRYRPWKNFQAAVEYLHWTTEYKELDDGTANRVDVHFSYYY